jgi:hypothetical protein
MRLNGSVFTLSPMTHHATPATLAPFAKTQAPARVEAMIVASEKV